MGLTLVHALARHLQPLGHPMVLWRGQLMQRQPSERCGVRCPCHTITDIITINPSRRDHGHERLSLAWR